MLNLWQISGGPARAAGTKAASIRVDASKFVPHAIFLFIPESLHNRVCCLLSEKAGKIGTVPILFIPSKTQRESHPLTNRGLTTASDAASGGLSTSKRHSLQSFLKRVALNSRRATPKEG